MMSSFGWTNHERKLMTRETPYARLLHAVREYSSGVEHPNRRTMWLYPKGKLNDGWSLLDLNERVAAADQLGFDVQVRSLQEGLQVQYVKRPPAINYDIW